MKRVPSQLPAPGGAGDFLSLDASEPARPGMTATPFPDHAMAPPALAARHLEVGVINAGDGAHEHPTQGLLDLLTLRDAWQGRFDGRRVAIVGDIAHSRVARSALFGLGALGVAVVVAGPPPLVPR